MADVAALSVIMMRVIMHYDGAYSTRHRDRREVRLAQANENGTVAGQIAHTPDGDIKVKTKSFNVQWINRRLADFPTNIQGDSIRLRFKAPLKRQL
jgi:hypothetical protein